jgi:arsenite methyltransferase
MFNNYRANMLNKEAGSPKNKASEIIKNINIQKEDLIADIGSGGGYFTFKFSNEVGKNGKVYSVDTNQKTLDYINETSKNQKYNNIQTVLVEGNGLFIPEKVDTIFLRNVFHHIPQQVEYFKNIKQFLKKEGKITIIEHKKKGFNFVSIFGHNTPEEVIIDTMDKAGYTLHKKLDFLPDQSFTIYKKK